MSQFDDVRVALSKKEKSATSCVEIADAERFLQDAVFSWSVGRGSSGVPQKGGYSAGLYPMHDTVPRAVRAAVRIDTMT